MKQFYCFGIIALCCVMLWPAQVFALSENPEIQLPSDIAQLQEMEERAGTQLLSGLSELWNELCVQAGGVVRQYLSSAVLLLCVVLICALAEDCCTAAGKKESLPMVAAAGAAGVTVIALGNLHDMIAVGIDTIAALDTYSETLLPTLMAAVAAGGGAVSAGVRHIAAVFFADILITLINDLLLPLVYVYAAASCADAFLPGRQLQNIAKAISKGITWLLSGLLILYTGYLTLAGMSASTADAAAVQAVRAAAGALPVVGSIISDAAGTVLSGAAMMKSSIGIAGTLGVLWLCLMPVLRLTVRYLLYKATAFLAGTLGSTSFTGLIDNLGSAFGLVLGMTGSCAVLLLISTITSVMVVTG